MEVGDIVEQFGEVVEQVGEFAGFLALVVYCFDFVCARATKCPVRAKPQAKKTSW